MNLNIIFETINKCILLLENNDIENDIEIIKKKKFNKENIIKYITSILNKINKLSNKLKVKLFKAITIGFISIIGLSQLLTSINNNTHISKETKIKRTTIVKQELKDNIKEYEDIKNVFISSTKYSNKLVNFLKYEEGDIKHKGKPVLTAYKIGDGMVTIGYGHAERTYNTKLIPKQTTISINKANQLLNDDIIIAQKDLDRLLKRWKNNNINYHIKQGMYDSMISMIFNMGLGNFLKSDFIQLIKSGNYKEDEKKNIIYSSFNLSISSNSISSNSISSSDFL